MQLALLILHFNLHEIGKLAGESLDALFQPRKVMFNLRAQQSFHAAVGKLRSQLANGSGGIMEHPGQRSAYPSFGSRTFEHGAVEDFNLIKMVALRLEELPSLVVGRFHNRIVISTKRNFGTV